MQTEVSFLADHVRYGLKLNPWLGAGNFLEHAYAVNANRDRQIIFSDKPCEALGERLGALSIARLRDVCGRYAAFYFAGGVRPMDPVAVYVAEGVQYLIQYVALTSLGAIPILTNGSMDPAVATRHFARTSAVALVTDRQHLARLLPHLVETPPKGTHCLEDIANVDPADLPAWYPFKHDHDDPVMVTHTSGTTGVPKAVVLQHGRWFYGIRHLLGLDPAPGADRYLSSLPASHNASIAYSIHAILNGAELMIMEDRSGRAVANAIAKFQPATIVSFPQTYVQLAGLDDTELDFRSVTTWINSGDAAHEAHIRRLVAHGYHYRAQQRIEGSQFVDGLGSSELGHSSFRIVHTPYTDSYDRCVGVPQSWVEAAVLDEFGEPTPLGQVGRLGVRSASVTTGYWNDSLTTYSSRLHGYWLTGDLAYRDHLGCYYHLDRMSDVVPTSQGPLYSLQTEELVLKHQPGLADCTIIGVTDRGASELVQAPVLLAVPRNGHALDSAALLREVNELQALHGRPPLARASAVSQDDIPVGVTGKVLKRQLRDQLSGRAA
ncbi:class I adenylate-forming enzyme family protein [Bradyrhizobium elkanii]|uniref:class I adenylate-forming enzyme family protein n=1 Tax=Bradyrhizobium elkanii TaxID=29448 RepID=UPI001BA93FB3|nr:class I adenylate-forming enzyme family protein [Bradyrhizobium elkanii]MBR1158094.1 acyl--CoA ligase [Bradyrhizobium elkanii]